jgi:hypothetical protein
MASWIGRVRAFVADPAVVFLLIVLAGLLALLAWALVWRFSGPSVSGNIHVRPLFGRYAG